MSEQPASTNRQRFKEFIQSQDVPRPICMPICSSLFPQSFDDGTDRGPWLLQSNLDAARECGYIPDKMFYDNNYVFCTDHPLGWHKETVGEFQGEPIIESRIETPLGPLTRVSKRIVDGRAVKDQLIRGEDDLKKAEWLIRARTGATGEVADAVRKVREFVGEELVLTFLLAQPFEIGYVGAALEECILLLYDYPDTFRRVMEASLKQARTYIRAVAEAGVDLIMIDSPGTELLSPRFFEEHVLQSSCELVRCAHECGRPITFHTCGRPWTYIQRGYYNSILPDIFESTSGPPEGDIPDQRKARELLDPRIAVRGSVSLALLRRGTPEQAYDEATRILDAFRGYRHILAGTCETMDGTPPENIVAMVKALEDWEG